MSLEKQLKNFWDTSLKALDFRIFELCRCDTKGYSRLTRINRSILTERFNFRWKIRNDSWKKNFKSFVDISVKVLYIILNIQTSQKWH